MIFDQMLHPERILAAKDPFLPMHFPDEAISMYNELILLFREGPRPALFVPRDFLDVLRKIDRKIPVQFLPDTKFFYLTFPPKTMFDGEDYIKGAYVYIGLGKNGGFLDDKWKERKVLAISYICEHETELGSLLIHLETSEKLADVLKNYQCVRYDDGGREISQQHLFGDREEFFRMILNTLIYIENIPFSGLLLDPSPMPHKKRLLKIKKKGGPKYYNFTKIPILVIIPHQDFQKEIASQKGLVSGHFRWQPYGPQLSKVKLIWINAHERNYVRKEIIAPEEVALHL